MKIPTAALEAFLAVARSRKFAAAAKALGLSQSALSQRILNLESQLEETLFVRDRTGARLTPEGEALLRYAQSQEALEAEYLGDRQPGILRVGAFSSVARSIVLPALAPLARRADVRFSLLSRELAELPELLRRGEADLALLDHAPGREGVSGSLLGFEENVLVRARGTKSDVFLDHDEGDATTHRYFQKFPRKGRLERSFLDDVYGLLDGVKLGLGSAILPLHIVEKEKGLEVVDRAKVLRTPVWLHFPAQAYLPKIQGEAREALKAFAKTILAKN